MLYKDLFGKTRKTAPADAESANAKLLIRGGFTDQLMAGVYSWLPLGLRVLRKVENIIREEMDNLGAQEVLLPALHPKENWEQTSRWDSMDVLFKVKSQTKKEYALGPTHEEVITPLVKKFAQSYKDLPIKLYQIQTKFRDELRAKSGVLRGREFGMKDLYSFHRNEDDLKAFYPEVVKSYLEIFDRCGLKAYLTTASGGSFTSGYSDEFQVISPAGEDVIVICKNCEKQGKKIAYNAEVFKTLKVCGVCGTGFENVQAKEKSIEAGNTFKLGVKFSDAFDLQYVDEAGKKQKAVMGAFGIGTTRLVGAIVEANHDDKGIIWPAAVAPFDAHLVLLAGKTGGAKVREAADDLYGELRRAGADVLYDDREDSSAGEKFSDADLVGIPIRIVVSEKTLAKDSAEIKERKEDAAELVPLSKIAAYLK
ncbi:hypothetical protein HYT45_02500 [Candidatus Uhrbacteria bacterium]|nr:hypothetical protein [Candidatus Uhrbacteria bacterium]